MKLINVWTWRNVAPSLCVTGWIVIFELSQVWPHCYWGGLSALKTQYQRLGYCHVRKIDHLILSWIVRYDRAIARGTFIITSVTVKPTFAWICCRKRRLVASNFIVRHVPTLGRTYPRCVAMAWLR